MNWLTENLGTLIPALLLVLVLGAVILNMVKSRKAGKSVSCGCSCRSCPSGGSCSKAAAAAKKQ
ncbi:MAG: FeoB-associated Cys-rich membrane protein [Eubacteriaceae bacterium]|jgi:hypothetical protein